MKTKTAKELRNTAWKRLAAEGTYWRYIAGTVVLTLVSILFVIGLVLLMVAGMAGLASLAGETSPVAMKGGQLDVAALFSHMSSLPPVVQCGSFAVSAMVVLGFVYLIGYSSWGQSAMSIAAVRGELRVGHALSGSGHGWRMGWMLLVAQTYAFLWSLLFIVPGIMAAFSYIMAVYVQVDHPDWGANRVIAESKRLMRGNRWRFFCFLLSYFGWFLLLMPCAMFLPLLGGTGALLSNVMQVMFAPYLHAGVAAFYEDLLDRDEMQTCNAA